MREGPHAIAARRSRDVLKHTQNEGRNSQASHNKSYISHIPRAIPYPTMLDAFKLKEFDLEPVLKSWKNPPRFLGNPKKDPSVDTWLDQVKEGCVERKIPKDYWHKVGQHFLGDKAKKRMEELKEVLRNLHGGNYRWDWKKFKTAMRNMGCASPLALSPSFY